MERKPGDIIEINGVKYKAVRPDYYNKEYTCHRCALFWECIKDEVFEITGVCSEYARRDRKNIYFEKIE